MQTSDRNPPQNQSIPVIDLTEDNDDGDDIDLLGAQPWENTSNSTPRLSKRCTISVKAGSSRINDRTNVTSDNGEGAKTDHDNMANEKEDLAWTCEVTTVDTTQVMGEANSTNGTTIMDDIATGANATENIAMLMDNMPMDTNGKDETVINMDAEGDTTMAVHDEKVDTNVIAGDATNNLDDSNIPAEGGYQSYSFYKYDWSNNTPTFTCLASTSDRYNITTSQSLALDQSILKKPMTSYLSRHSKSSTNNFFKSCHWSPDGTCLLTNSEDRMIRLFDVPLSIYDPSQSEPIVLEPSLGILEGESICDVAWFPSMNSQDPATCCFLSSVRDHPIRLWDATTGKVRASYCVVDHQERFIGPNVLKFNLDGTKIYCGYENTIEIFDVHAPGNNTSTKLSTTPNRKSRKGQKGIISCLDFNPDHSGMYAAGSYSQSIGIYDERTNDLCLKLTGMKGGGVTQVKFSVDGNFLYSASRQSNTISCWDVRQSGNILYELDRKGKTNQRITFDLDPTGSVLVTGDQDGHVLAYDLTTADNEDIETKPRLLSSWDAHQDIVSGATFNPGYPSVMATCSGQRKFEIDQSDDDSDSEEVIVDNILKIWHLAGQYEWYSMDMETTVDGMDLDVTQ